MDEKGNAQWVWVPVYDQDKAFLPAKILKQLYKGALEIQYLDGTKQQLQKHEAAQVIPLDSVSLLDEIYPDLVFLEDLTKPMILYNLEKRFERNEIYTNVGTILISINPYQRLPLYTPSVLQRYIDRGADILDPHVYEIAESTFTDLIDFRRNNSIVISGESGAGKTEATKQCLQFLAEVAASSDSNIEQKILLANPILEAFGNAKTSRNNNSSRFGKYVEIFFDAKFGIAYAQNINYLLEKVRVTNPGPYERNYHIFYHILAGAPPDMRRNLRIGNKKPQDYHYLNRTGCFEITGVDDAQDFGDVLSSFELLDIDEKEVFDVLQLTSAVLNLGNVSFTEIGERECVISDNSVLEAVADLLQVPKDELGIAVTSKSLKSVRRGSNVTKIFLSASESADNRDALAKFLYDVLFDWLVQRINQAFITDIPSIDLSIGVLDIFGFEIFEVNSFEQLCINWTNEVLQQFFNANTFRLEEQLYQDEGIDYIHVEYIDNQPVVDLISRKGIGILPILDESLRIPQASDVTFVSKLHETHKDTSEYSNVLRNPMNFVVYHYAGPVEYSAEGFMDKNRDTLEEDLKILIENKTSNNFLKMLVELRQDKTKKKRTVARQFNRQLNDLQRTLQATEPHYIRCIKPNTNKSPIEFCAPMVLEQLTNSGVFEAVEIRKKGYPFRLTHEEFCRRYKAINPYLESSTDPRGTAIQLINEMKMDTQLVKIGRTRILYKTSDHRDMEKLRFAALDMVCTDIQKRVRGWLARRALKRWKQRRKEIRAAVQERDLDQLNIALSRCENIKIELRELSEARRLKYILEREVIVKERIRKILKEDPEERYNEYESVIAAADDIDLDDDLAKRLREKFAIVQERRECVRSLREAVTEQSESKLKEGLDKAIAYSLDVSYDDIIRKAQELYDRIQQEKPLVARIEVALQTGGYVNEGDLVDSFNLYEVFKEAESIGMITTRGKQIFEEAFVILGLRQILAPALETTDKNLWSSVERFLVDNQEKYGSRPEFKAAKNRLSFIYAVDEVENMLQEAINYGDAPRLDVVLESAERVGLTPDVSPVYRFALEKREEFVEARARLEEALVLADPRNLSDAILFANQVGFQNSGVLDDCYELQNYLIDLEQRLDALLSNPIPDVGQEILEECFPYNYLKTKASQLKNLLETPSDNASVIKALKSALELRDWNKVVKLVMKKCEILSERVIERLLEFQTYAKLKDPKTFADAKSFSLNRQALEDSFYVFTRSYIHTSLMSGFADPAVKEAKLTFKLIQGIIGVRPNSSGNVLLALELVSKGIRFTLLRAEIYCQIVKQLTSNPSETASRKAWKLLILCLDCFPPQQNLDEYLEIWIYQNAPRELRELALIEFYVTQYIGARPVPPSRDEITLITDGNSSRLAGLFEEIKMDTGQDFPPPNETSRVPLGAPSFRALQGPPAPTPNAAYRIQQESQRNLGVPPPQNQAFRIQQSFQPANPEPIVQPIVQPQLDQSFLQASRGPLLQTQSFVQPSLEQSFQQISQGVLYQPRPQPPLESGRRIPDQQSFRRPGPNIARRPQPQPRARLVTQQSFRQVPQAQRNLISQQSFRQLGPNPSILRSQAPPESGRRIPDQQSFRQPEQSFARRPQSQPRARFGPQQSFRQEVPQAQNPQSFRPSPVRLDRGPPPPSRFVSSSARPAQDGVSSLPNRGPPPPSRFTQSSIRPAQDTSNRFQAIPARPQQSQKAPNRLQAAPNRLRQGPSRLNRPQAIQDRGPPPPSRFIPSPVPPAQDFTSPPRGQQPIPARPARSQRAPNRFQGAPELLRQGSSRLNRPQAILDRGPPPPSRFTPSPVPPVQDFALPPSRRQPIPARPASRRISATVAQNPPSRQAQGPAPVPDRFRPIPARPARGSTPAPNRFQPIPARPARDPATANRFQRVPSRPASQRAPVGRPQSDEQPRILRRSPPRRGASARDVQRIPPQSLRVKKTSSTPTGRPVAPPAQRVLDNEMERSFRQASRRVPSRRSSLGRIPEVPNVPAVQSDVQSSRPIPFRRVNRLNEPSLPRGPLPETSTELRHLVDSGFQPPRVGPPARPVAQSSQRVLDISLPSRRGPARIRAPLRAARVPRSRESANSSPKLQITGTFNGPRVPPPSRQPRGSPPDRRPPTSRRNLLSNLGESVRSLQNPTGAPIPARRAPERSRIPDRRVPPRRGVGSRRIPLRRRL